MKEDENDTVIYKYRLKISALADMAANYADNKAALKHVQKVVAIELKQYRTRPVVTLTQTAEATEKYGELYDLIADLRRVKRIEDYKRAEKALTAFARERKKEVINEEIKLNPVTELSDSLQKAAKNIEDGVQKIGDYVGQGVEQLKKTIRGDR